MIWFSRRLKINKFAKRLKELRKENKMSQEELSKETCFNQSTISKWERGEREPNIEVLILLADFFKVSTDYLFGLEDWFILCQLLDKSVVLWYKKGAVKNLIYITVLAL